MNIIRTVTVLLFCFCSYSFASDREISVKGAHEFKIKISGTHIILKGDELQGATLENSSGIWVLEEHGERFKIEPGDNGAVSLSSSSGAKYTVQKQDQGYSIFVSGNQLLNRVKIKEDKFNVYDKDAKRILHGKQKEDGYGVKDEKGTQVLKIKGVHSLREASFFALQIPVQYQVLTWAQEFANSESALILERRIIG